MGYDAVEAQRDYYARTAEHYEAMHVAAGDEHGIALTVFAGFAARAEATTVLDVGAGTGRALQILIARLPGVQLIGVEPVAELRAIGHAGGIPAHSLIEGDAMALPFADDSFDFVIETGVLHHVADPGKMVHEMARVARKGVMLSDSNNLGQGGAVTRTIKVALHHLGLWRMSVWLATGGRMRKWSEGDGVFYSYSVFDSLALLRVKFPRLHLMNTVPLQGSSLRRGAPQVCVIALADTL